MRGGTLRSLRCSSPGRGARRLDAAAPMAAGCGLALSLDSAWKAFPYFAAVDIPSAGFSLGLIDLCESATSAAET